LENLIKKFKIKYIVHLAAQAGVRYSIENPKAYMDSNIIGTYNIIELSKKINIIFSFNNFILNQIQIESFID